MRLERSFGYQRSKQAKGQVQKSQVRQAEDQAGAICLGTRVQKIRAPERQLHVAAVDQSQKYIRDYTVTHVPDWASHSPSLTCFLHTFPDSLIEIIVSVICSVNKLIKRPSHTRHCAKC